MSAAGHQEPPRFVTGATGASPETGRGGGAPMIGNLKLASSMTLIRSLGSPTYWRDCATTPRVGSSKCCRGIGKPLAWQSRRDYPPIASPRSACGAPQMHVRVQCTTRLAHGLQLNGRGPSPMCAHRVLSRPTAWGMCWDNSHEFQHVCPGGRYGFEGYLSFGQQRHPPGSAWVLQKMPRAAYDGW